jgi:hypothetical protein
VVRETNPSSWGAALCPGDRFRRGSDLHVLDQMIVGGPTKPIALVDVGGLVVHQLRGTAGTVDGDPPVPAAHRSPRQPVAAPVALRIDMADFLSLTLDQPSPRHPTLVSLN